MNRLSIPLLSACVLLSLLPGCAGYRLGDVKPSAYAGIDALHVPTFENQTLEPRLSSLVTNAVLKEIHVDGTYRVTNRANSDAVLVGEIERVRKRQLRAVRTDTLRSQELSLFLYVNFHLEDPVTGERIHSTVPEGDEYGKGKRTEADRTIRARQGRIVGETIQFVDKSFQVGERSALSVAAEDVARQLVSQLANGW